MDATVVAHQKFFKSKFECTLAAQISVKVGGLGVVLDPKAALRQVLQSVKAFGGWWSVFARPVMSCSCSAR